VSIIVVNAVLSTSASSHFVLVFERERSATDKLAEDNALTQVPLPRHPFAQQELSTT
jgi:hypothetical protein